LVEKREKRKATEPTGCGRVWLLAVALRRFHFFFNSAALLALFAI